MYSGQNVLLRGLELSDVPELMKHWNNTEVKKFLNSFTPHSIQEEEEFIKHTWKIRKEGKAHVFAIVSKENDLYIGNIDISIVDSNSRRGVIGIAIFNQSYWNRGFGTEALNLIINFAFKTLNLHSVELQVFSNNLRAKHCYEKCGFKESGLRREAIYVEGSYFDSILMDITKKEWINKKT